MGKNCHFLQFFEVENCLDGTYSIFWRWNWLELAQISTSYSNIKNTLRVQINVRRTIINFGNFSCQYFLIWDRTFINFEEYLDHFQFFFCKKAAVLFSFHFFNRSLIILPFKIVYLGPYVYWFLQSFHPVWLFGPLRLFGPLE